MAALAGEVQYASAMASIQTAHGEHALGAAVLCSWQVCIWTWKQQQRMFDEQQQAAGSVAADSRRH
jgi:hypothetical protein